MEEIPPYNPAKSVVNIYNGTETSQREEKLPPFDPYKSQVNIYPDPNEVKRTQSARELDELPELPFWKAKSREKHPIASAIYGSLASITWEFLPVAKYYVKENGAEFQKLSDEEQNKAAMMSGVGTALMVTPFPKFGKLGKTILKDVLKGGAKAYQAIPKVVKPIEDIGVWQAKHYRADAIGRLMKNRGMSELEATVITDALEGNASKLASVLIDSEVTPSKGFLKSIKVVTKEGVAKESIEEMGFNALNDIVKLRNSTALHYSPEALRHKSLIRSFRNNVDNILYTKIDQKYEVAFKAQAERFYGKEAAKTASFAQATDEELTAFTKNMIVDEVAKGNMSAMLKPSALNMFQPVRYVLQKGEKLFKTESLAYDRIKRSQGNKNIYVATKSEEFKAMLAQSGYLKAVTKVTKAGEKITHYEKLPIFTKELLAQTNKLMRDIDDVMQTALNKSRGLEKREGKAIIFKGYEDVAALTKSYSPEVQGLMSLTHNFFDKLYMERSLWKIEDIFEKAGILTQVGRRKVQSVLKATEPELNRIFSTEAGIPGVAKVDLLKKELDRIKAIYNTDKEVGIKWYQGTDDKKIFQTLDRSLTYGETRDGFMNYLDNYRPRNPMFNSNLVDDLLQGSNVASRKYIHERVLSKAKEEQLDFMEMVLGRVQAQGREIFVDDTFKEVINFAKTLPPEYRDYIHHYIARLMNLPSQADLMVANILQSTIGKVEQRMGKSGVWDARRAMQLSKTLNDFTYMAFLGFKPFSAMRNMFQPLVMVPADLGGGARSLSALAKGYRELIDPKTSLDMRKYLKDIGAISEFIPEFEYTKSIVPFKPKLFGKEFSIDDLRDWSMFMFKRADRYNRYVAGSSASIFWDDALNLISKELEKSGKFVEAGKERLSVALRSGDEKILNEFYKKSGINGRRETIRERLKDLIEAGRFEDAKKMFVTDVVADTQYLYGHVDSPLFLSSLGAVGKNATIFQSWWMNYGTQLHKWAVTGEGSLKFKRSVNMLISSGIAYLIMQSIWNKSTAAKTVLLGPFPDPSYGIPFPPTWKPFLEMAKTAYKAGEMLTFSDTTAGDVATQAKKALGTTVMTLTPGGLQLKQTINRTMDEGIPGAFKSVIKYKNS